MPFRRQESNMIIFDSLVYQTIHLDLVHMYLTPYNL